MQKRHAIIESEIQSPNFSFLANLDPPLMHQAANAFKDTEITGLQKFADIFAIKELEDKDPERETSVQIATIQGMVRRILYAEDEAEKPKVDQFQVRRIKPFRGSLLSKLRTIAPFFLVVVSVS